VALYLFAVQGPRWVIGADSSRKPAARQSRVHNKVNKIDTDDDADDTNAARAAITAPTLASCETSGT
jgi:hypothetical protein